MINKVIIYALVAALVASVGYAVKEKIVNIRISSENNDLNEAVSHYEEMVKILPYNVLAKERKEKANEEINATLGNDSVINGTFRL